MSIRDRAIPHGAVLVLALGAFLFARTASTALHETGHAIPSWLAGAGAEYIFFHPFAGGAFESAADPGEAYIWSVAGGPIGGSILSLLLMLGAARWRGPATLWAFMTPFVACTSNGAQLTVLLLMGRHDAATLVDVGAPPLLVFGSGVVILLLAAVCGLLCIPLMGIGPGDGVGKRVLLLGSVLVFYVTIATGYSLAYGWWERVRLMLFALPPALAVMGLFALASREAQARLRWTWLRDAPPVTWSAALLNLALGCVAAGGAMALMASSPSWTAE